MPNDLTQAGNLHFQLTRQPMNIKLNAKALTKIVTIIDSS